MAGKVPDPLSQVDRVRGFGNRYGLPIPGARPPATPSSLWVLIRGIMRNPGSPGSGHWGLAEKTTAATIIGLCRGLGAVTESGCWMSEQANEHAIDFNQPNASPLRIFWPG